MRNQPTAPPRQDRRPPEPPWRRTTFVLQNLGIPLVLLVLVEFFVGMSIGQVVGTRVRAAIQLTVFAVGAAVLYLTGLGAAALWRERQRQRCGQCINCGCDLRRRRDRCPECGRKLESPR